jgi:hypothetical protein
MGFGQSASDLMEKGQAGSTRLACWIGTWLWLSFAQGSKLSIAVAIAVKLPEHGR